LKVDFGIIRLKNTIWANQVTSDYQNWSLMGAEGAEPPALGDFWKFIKISHFRQISAEIQSKNLKLVHYLFLEVRGNIRLGRPWVPLWLRPWYSAA